MGFWLGNVMRTTVLLVALIVGTGSSFGKSEGRSLDVDLSLEMPVLSASVVTKSALKRFEFSHRPPPLRLRENDELDVPRFFTCGEWCENLANDWIGYTVLERPMTVERLEAFWVPITGNVDSVLVVEFADSPNIGHVKF